jgi:hypothetical protein
MIAVSKDLEKIARRLDRLIEEAAGERVSFSLFVWTEGRCSYISTANRDDVIQVLEGMIAGWKAGMPDVPAHNVS